MLKILTNGTTYDWSTWAMGIWRAILGGGSGGVIAGLLAMGIDPEKFNFTTGIHKELVMMSSAFILQGVIHLFIFLQTHPGPELHGGTDVPKT